LHLYEHPDNLFVAGFIGSPGMNMLDGVVVEASERSAKVRLGGGEVIDCLVNAATAKTGDAVKLGVRPEHLQAGVSGNALKTTVTFVESLGSITYAYCSNPGSPEVITAAVDGQTRVQNGDRMELGVPTEWAYLFDDKGQAFQRLSTTELRRAA
jgi:multiple sugar transport system ATP-binding protein